MDCGRLIVDAGQEGGMNMAVDEALLEGVSRTGEAVLRFYQWEPATLSLGYFQSLGDRVGHEESRSLSVVRRSTGGGAIVHDHELTYSLMVPIRDRMRRDHRDLYVAVHRAVAGCLADHGLEAELHGGDEVGGEVPFLCFQRRADGDLVVGAEKVLGSAQRRRSDALLQHGSILLRRSSSAPQLPGILDLASLKIAEDGLIRDLRGAIMAALTWEWRESRLRPDEMTAANRLRSEKYLSSSWTERR